MKKVWGKTYTVWADEELKSDIEEIDLYPNFDAKTEADARAKMLIYLKENNLI